MGTLSIHLGAGSLAWKSLWRNLTWGSATRDCVHTHKFRFRIGAPGVLFGGARYCIGQCLEGALADALRIGRFSEARKIVPHRIPLGLLLLSRQQLTTQQLQVALEAQRVKGQGRIGEWLQNLGFVNEGQVTAALARQWSCPVLRASSFLAPGRRLPQLPLTLLSGFAMVPVGYVEARSSLHIAFSEGPDYSVLYAIERMTGCHTEACMAAPTFVQSHLQALIRQRGDAEIIFERVPDTTEICRIICSYCARLSPTELRIAFCHPFLWVRLFRGRSPFDLLLRPLESSHSAWPSKITPSVAV